MSFDPLFSYVKLLCPFDGANGSTTFTDIKGHALVAGGYAEQISTTQSKWGGSSLKIIGGLVKASAHSNDFNVGLSTDLCIDFWVYIATGFYTTGRIVGSGINSEKVNWGVDITTARQVRFITGNSLVSVATMDFSPVIPLDTWTHVRVAKAGTAVECWVNGSSGGTGTVSSATAQGNDKVWIGAAHSLSIPTIPFYGYLDDLRVTVGNVRAAENGLVPTEAYPTSAPLVTYQIIGNIQTVVAPYSYYIAPVARAFTGNIQTTVVPQSVTKAHKKRKASGMIVTRLVPSAILSKPVVVPAGWVSREFRCLLTGSPDLVLPVSNINADLSASGGSSVTLSLHGAADIIDDVIARNDGNIVISRVHKYANGSEVERPFITVKYDQLSSYTGSRAGTTITLTGRSTIKATTSKLVELAGVSYRSVLNGTVHVRCSINDALSLGDTAIVNGESIVVGKIAYNMTAKTEVMEITEYQSDGADLPGSIGRNARALSLSEYYVTFANINYNLWMTNAFYYSGIVATGLTIGQPYNLYSDSAGLLWYLPGLEGTANYPVMLSDTITQASINV